MKIIRQTPTEIVVRDSTLWVAVVCGIMFLVIGGSTVQAHNWKGFAFSFLLLAFVFGWLRRSTFTFNEATRTIRWRQFRYFNVATGEIPFSSVQDIALEATTSAIGNVMTYRLALVTPQGRVPMSDSHSGRHDRISKLRDKLLAFVAVPGSPATYAAAASGRNPDEAHAARLNADIRVLLQQGRKVDAILLVQRTDHLDLTEATFRVNQIAHQSQSRR
jgi:hypothetical protein